MIRISFIIPTYNHGDTLVRCIESIESQFKLSQNDYEIIIVNDGSTDNSYDVIATLASKNNNIKPIDKENSGVSSARNIGIAAAKGKYTYFVDADDYLFQDSIQNQIDLMEKLDLDTLKVGHRSVKFSHNTDIQQITPPHFL
ncbi:MAG: glycosyltransferase [Clostridium sp.]|nr:glycosyltransferase [Clostridium sp.]